MASSQLDVLCAVPRSHHARTLSHSFKILSASGRIQDLRPQVCDLPRIQLSVFDQGLRNRLNGMGMVCNELPGGGVCRVEEVSDAQAQVFGYVR